MAIVPPACYSYRHHLLLAPQTPTVSNITRKRDSNLPRQRGLGQQYGPLGETGQQDYSAIILGQQPGISHREESWGKRLGKGSAKAAGNLVFPVQNFQSEKKNKGESNPIQIDWTQIKELIERGSSGVKSGQILDNTRSLPDKDLVLGELQKSVDNNHLYWTTVLEKRDSNLTRQRDLGQQYGPLGETGQQDYSAVILGQQPGISHREESWGKWLGKGSAKAAGNLVFPVQNFQSEKKGPRNAIVFATYHVFNNGIFLVADFYFGAWHSWALAASRELGEIDPPLEQRINGILANKDPGNDASKKVDALEERLEGAMNQIKATVEDRISSMEKQFSDLRDIVKKILDLQTKWRHRREKLVLSGVFVQIILSEKDNSLFWRGGEEEVAVDSNTSPQLITGKPKDARSFLSIPRGSRDCCNWLEFLIPAVNWEQKQQSTINFLHKEILQSVSGQQLQQFRESAGNCRSLYMRDLGEC
ncbi:hypothetical protein M5K25_023770 [Dendrobium thyrsiflorum]|uniref:Uncharacterized protein n=1 Tax=Dendrobium thyrsiflorum TaxID=117978 RepID=A0ABD0U0D9_DENTH